MKTYRTLAEAPKMKNLVLTWFAGGQTWCQTIVVTDDKTVEQYLDQFDTFEPLDAWHCAYKHLFPEAIIEPSIDKMRTMLGANDAINVLIIDPTEEEK